MRRAPGWLGYGPADVLGEEILARANPVGGIEVVGFDSVSAGTEAEGEGVEFFSGSAGDESAVDEPLVLDDGGIDGIDPELDRIIEPLAVAQMDRSSTTIVAALQERRGLGRGRSTKHPRFLLGMMSGRCALRSDSRIAARLGERRRALSRRLRPVDRFRPMRDLLGRHRSLRLEPRVAIAPLPQIRQKLRARDQRAAANSLLRRRFVELPL
jgi:hypothetical protein